MGNKYALSDTVHPDYKNLVRVIALRDIPEFGVLKGDLGGYVSGTHNLAQAGAAWIMDDAVARDKSYICDNALARDSALLEGNAKVCGSAILSGTRVVKGFDFIKW